MTDPALELFLFALPNRRVSPIHSASHPVLFLGSLPRNRGRVSRLDANGVIPEGSTVVARVWRLAERAAAIAGALADATRWSVAGRPVACSLVAARLVRCCGGKPLRCGGPSLGFGLCASP